MASSVAVGRLTAAALAACWTWFGFGWAHVVCCSFQNFLHWVALEKSSCFGWLDRVQSKNRIAARRQEVLNDLRPRSFCRSAEWVSVAERPRTCANDLTTTDAASCSPHASLPGSTPLPRSTSASFRSGGASTYSLSSAYWSCYYLSWLAKSSLQKRASCYYSALSDAAWMCQPILAIWTARACSWPVASSSTSLRASTGPGCETAWAGNCLTYFLISSFGRVSY